MIRAYETNSSAKILYINYAQLEVGIDPIYQSAGLSIEEGTATSGFVSDLIGTNTTGVTPNDDNPLKISSSGANKNIEFVLTFRNIKGENLIFDMFALSSRLRASTSGVTFKYGIYNNSTSSWEYIKDGDNNYSMFTYYIDHHVAMPSSSYINEDREYKIKIVTNTMASVFYVELDYLNLIALKDSSFEGSNFGTVSGYWPPVCMGSSYRTFDTLKTTQSSCSVDGRSGYPNDYFALDDDNDASSADYIVDLRFTSAVTYPSGSSINAIHYGFYLSNLQSTITISPQIRNYSSYSTGGWIDTPSTDNINNSTVYYNSWVHLPQKELASNFVYTNTGNSTYTGELGMRFRTSTSSASSTVSVNYYFSGMSIRYSQVNNAPTLSNALFNDQEDITVGSYFGAPTAYYVLADIYDEQGCETIQTITGCAYRSGSNDKTCALAGQGKASASLSCSVTNCSGTGDKTATASCILYALNTLDPTDAGTP